MAFAGGLHVFPGGRVEAADSDPRLVARSRGPVEDPAFHLAHRIAAIRETWEEVGVLLAAPGLAPALIADARSAERPRPARADRAARPRAHDRRPRRGRPVDDAAGIPTPVRGALLRRRVADRRSARHRSAGGRRPRLARLRARRSRQWPTARSRCGRPRRARFSASSGRRRSRPSGTGWRWALTARSRSSEWPMGCGS